MNLGNKKLEVDKILGIISVEEPNETITLKDLREVQQMVENTFNIKFKYGIVRREPGYYFSYVLSTNQVIVCGSMSKKECVERTREYAKTGKL